MSLFARTTGRMLGRFAQRRAVVAQSATAQRLFSEFRTEPAQAGSLLDIGTREIYDETHDQFRETTRKFYAEQVVPDHPKWEEQVQHVQWSYIHYRHVAACFVSIRPFVVANCLHCQFIISPG